MIAERGLTRSRASAAEAIRAGRVVIGTGGRRVAKPSELIEPDAELAVASGRDYVSRGGVKLANALDVLEIDVSGRDCLDVGASTGGFTDCLLQRGAARVIALDVAHGQLDWGLRNDERVTVIERSNARDIDPGTLPFEPSLATVDVSFISLTKVLPSVASAVASGGEILAMVKPQFELGQKRVKGGVVRDPAERREALATVAASARELGLAISGFASSGLPGPKGNRETFLWATTDGRRARRSRGRAGDHGGRAMSAKPAVASVLTHTQPEQTSAAVRAAAEVAAEVGCRLVASAEEREKHGDGGIRLRRARGRSDPDLCLVLGGDGTILKALRQHAGSDVPVFGINYGTIGFLAAADRPDLEDGLRKALTGEFEVMALPALDVGAPGAGRIALNDVSFHRRPHGRVAELAIKLSGQEVGHVRCDGLVAATPAGSTGYNLANQGPILAWGVEGYVVSFIAPHTLTARPLVVAPDDVLYVTNAAGREAVDLVVDGEHVTELASGDETEVHFRDNVGRLAQLEGANFYRRIGEKFGGR